MNFITLTNFCKRKIIPRIPRVGFLKNISDSTVVGIKFDNNSAGNSPALFTIKSIQLFTLSNHIKTVDKPLLRDPSSVMIRQELIDKLVWDGRGFVI